MTSCQRCQNCIWHRHELPQKVKYILKKLKRYLYKSVLHKDLTNSVLSPEAARGQSRAGRGRLLARAQDPRVRGDVSVLGSAGVISAGGGARGKQGREEGAFRGRLVLGVTGHHGSAASLLARAAHGGQLLPDGLSLGQGLRIPPQISLDQRQVVLQLHQDLVLRRSQSTGLQVKVKGRLAEGVKERRVSPEEVLVQSWHAVVVKTRDFILKACWQLRLLEEKKSKEKKEQGLWLKELNKTELKH